MDKTQRVRALTYILTGTLGIIAGMHLASYLERPTSVYARDLSKDNRPDIVVRSRGANPVVFLQQENGTYRLSYEIQKEQRDSLEAKVMELEAKAMELETRAKEIK